MIDNPSTIPKDLLLVLSAKNSPFGKIISKFRLNILALYTLQVILAKKYLVNIVYYIVEGGAVLNISGAENLSNKSLIKFYASSSLESTPPKMFLDFEEPSILDNNYK